MQVVRREDEIVVLDGDKPSRLIFNVSEDSFETILRAIRLAKATIAFHEMRTLAAENGYMTDEEINEKIIARRGKNAANQELYEQY